VNFPALRPGDRDDDEREAQVRDAALLLLGELTPEEFAAQHRLDVPAVTELLTELGADAEARSVRMRLSGEANEARSTRLLGSVLTRLEQLVAAGDVGAATLVKVADTLHKISGLAERRSVELRRESMQPKSSASIIVILRPGGEEVRLTGNGGAQLIDVTPDTGEDDAL